tara:strand:- start:884 stop:1351 length:468 start_codon:yes stop_codon:yes gene_type:complete
MTGTDYISDPVSVPERIQHVGTNQSWVQLSVSVDPEVQTIVQQRNLPAPQALIVDCTDPDEVVYSATVFADPAETTGRGQQVFLPQRPILSVLNRHLGESVSGWPAEFRRPGGLCLMLSSRGYGAALESEALSLDHLLDWFYWSDHGDEPAPILD